MTPASLYRGVDIHTTASKVAFGYTSLGLLRVLLDCVDRDPFAFRVCKDPCYCPLALRWYVCDLDKATSIIYFNHNSEGKDFGAEPSDVQFFTF